MSMDFESAPTSPTRCGYVTIVGRPNAGKSTLLNALLGTHLSIVTPKAQTTWQRVTGILTDDAVQMVFLDTPGLLDARTLVQRSMLGAAELAVEEADVLLLVLDAVADEPDRLESSVGEVLGGKSVPVVAAVNKVDRISGNGEIRVRALEGWAEAVGATTFRVSALRGDGVDALREAIAERLPSGPFLFPPDEIATQPVRFFVAELVREAVFERYDEEIPYATAARVEEFREDQDPLYVGVTLFVERESQKGILIGKRGRAIRQLGADARGRIEHFLGRRVYLDLWVKKLSNWRRRRGHLARLGFRLREERDAPNG